MSSTVQSINSTLQAQASQYLPEPANRGIGLFNDFMKSMGNFAGSVAGDVPGMIGDPFLSLINKQMEVQREMQATTMISNIERSKHESRMAAVRNMRMS